MDDTIRLNNPKDTIITVDANELIKYVESEHNSLKLDIRYLPEDIYVFSDLMDWCVVFTHEWFDANSRPELGLKDDEQRRICFVLMRLGTVLCLALLGDPGGFEFRSNKT